MQDYAPIHPAAVADVVTTLIAIGQPPMTQAQAEASAAAQRMPDAERARFLALCAAVRSEYARRMTTPAA